jgi:RimJ/RimL family protein N-acetyltransferase
MTPTTRRLTARDALTYRALMLDAYARHPDAFTSSVDERAALPIAWWENRLGGKDANASIVFAAFDGDRMVGVAGLSFEPRSKARHKASLFGMYVPAAFRSCGIGRALVATVLEHARARPGVALVQLTVTDGNAAARALYERFGFVEFGVEPFAVAVDGGYVSKVHMWRKLPDPAQTAETPSG